MIKMNNITFSGVGVSCTSLNVHQRAIYNTCRLSPGRYMVTSGMDKKLKVYDIRTFKPLKSYFLPAGASCLSLSQRGLLSAATGDIVQVIINSTLHD